MSRNMKIHLTRDLALAAKVRGGGPHRSILTIGRKAAPGRVRRYQLVSQGRAFGITFVTSTSLNIPPATNPSRTQSNAAHQAS